MLHRTWTDLNRSPLTRGERCVLIGLLNVGGSFFSALWPRPWATGLVGVALCVALASVAIVSIIPIGFVAAPTPSRLGCACLVHIAALVGLYSTLHLVLGHRWQGVVKDVQVMSCLGWMLLGAYSGMAGSPHSRTLEPWSDSEDESDDDEECVELLETSRWATHV